MRRKYIYNFTFLSILVFGIICCQAQNNPTVEGLTQTISICNSDSLKVEYLNELSWLCRTYLPDSALAYASRAKLLSEKINFKAGVATSLNRIGDVERFRGNYDKAIAIFQEALKIEKAINNTYGIARANGQLSLLYKSIGEIEKAFETNQISIEIYKDLNNLSALANAYDRQAELEKYIGKYDEALKYGLSGLSLREQIKDSDSFLFSFMGLAETYKRLYNYDLALAYSQKAIDMALKLNDQTRLAQIYTNISAIYYDRKQFKTAIDYNLKSIDIKKQLAQDKVLSSNYNNLGNCYNELGDYDRAIHFYTKSIKIREENGEYEDLGIAYNNIGNLFFNRGQYDQAISYYEKGLENAEKNNEKLIILELYHNIYRSYTATGKLENAVSFNNKYIALRDSLDIAYRNAINIKDAYLEEQKKNQLLEKDNLINEVKLKRRNILIISLSVGMILLILLFFTLFRSYRFKQRTLLAEKNNEINEQKISKLLKDQELKSMSAMLEGQDGERKRIAQDLHDRLGSMLSMVKLHFKSVEENIQAIRETNLVMYSKANNLLDEACEEVRKIANDLNSGVLNKFGLIPALKSLQESIVGTGQLNIEVLDFGFDDNRLEYAIEINLYRVIQELISNILKHSKASEVSIQLLKKEKRLNIVVEDNGLGFDVNQIKNKKGMGLKNIESRVDSLKGEFNIDSGKGAGTTITIEIPLN